VASPSTDIDTLRRAFRAHHQEHVFEFWERLSPESRDALIAQAARIAPGLPDWTAERTRAVEALSSDAVPTIAPADALALPEHGGDARRIEEARRRGEVVLAAGRVGVFVVAGGQGTRLGFPQP